MPTLHQEIGNKQLQKKESKCCTVMKTFQWTNKRNGQRSYCHYLPQDNKSCPYPGISVQIMVYASVIPTPKDHSKQIHVIEKAYPARVFGEVMRNSGNYDYVYQVVKKLQPTDLPLRNSGRYFFWRPPPDVIIFVH
jgi:hypothetical protein